MEADVQQEAPANPFMHAPVAARPSENAVANTESQRAVAEVQGAMVIAKRFPRNQIEAMDRVLQACTRPTLAESALYEYSRGGTSITGPSIRLAETIAQAWGNIQFGIRELDQRNGESTVEAFAWDVETNTRQVKVFQVAHKRHTKNGSYPLTDPRDIYEMVANQGARRLRACVLGIIPGDVIEEAVKQCEVTLKAKTVITPEFIQSVVEAFEKYGVTKEQIEKRIQRRIDTLTPGLAVQLKKIVNSMRDGMSKPADWFDMTPTAEAGAEPSPQTGNAGVKDALKRKKPEAEKKEPPANPAPVGPTIRDALALVNKGDYDEAQDLVSGTGFTDIDRAEIKAAVKRHKEGERV